MQQNNQPSWAANLTGQSNDMRLDLNPEKVEQGLLKLVLSVLELVRQLLERQAMRRMEGGRLSDNEVEQLGLTLMRLEQAIVGLQKKFDIDDLNIDLGPLGKLFDEV
jgi:hypothetical protein